MRTSHRALEQVRPSVPSVRNNSPPSSPSPPPSFLFLLLLAVAIVVVVVAAEWQLAVEATLEC